MEFFLGQSQAYAAWGKLYDPDDPWIEEPFSSGEKMATPLYYASLADLQRTAQALTEQGAIINAQGGIYGNALQAASGGGYKEIVQLLLEKGADIHTQADNFGDNALQAASGEGHKEIVPLLLEKGAKVNKQGGYYNNALQAPSAEGHYQVVQLLLKNGAEINMQGGAYGSALRAASVRGHLQIVQLLLERRQSIDAQVVPK